MTDEEYLQFLAQEDADLGEVNPYGFFPQDFRYPRNTLTQNIPIAIAQNPAMVNYGIGTLPQFDIANLPMYEKDDSEQEYIPGTDPQESGIAKLFQFLGNLPTPFNLARRGLESLRGFNKKIRGTTFALSPTLKDYVQAKRAEKKAAAGADVGVGPGGSGSRRGDADIASRDRGSFRTDDTAGFF